MEKETYCTAKPVSEVFKDAEQVVYPRKESEQVRSTIEVVRYAQAAQRLKLPRGRDPDNARARALLKSQIQEEGEDVVHGGTAWYYGRESRSRRGITLLAYERTLNSQIHRLHVSVLLPVRVAQPTQNGVGHEITMKTFCQTQTFSTQGSTPGSMQRLPRSWRYQRSTCSTKPQEGRAKSGTRWTASLEQSCSLPCTCFGLRRRSWKRSWRWVGPPNVPRLELVVQLNRPTPIVNPAEEEGGGVEQRGQRGARRGGEGSAKEAGGPVKERKGLAGEFNAHPGLLSHEECCDGVFLSHPFQAATGASAADVQGESCRPRVCTGDVSLAACPALLKLTAQRKIEIKPYSQDGRSTGSSTRFAPAWAGTFGGLARSSSLS